MIFCRLVKTKQKASNVTVFSFLSSHKNQTKGNGCRVPFRAWACTTPTIQPIPSLVEVLTSSVVLYIVMTARVSGGIILS
jgi:hypothetical protein